MGGTFVDGNKAQRSEPFRDKCPGRACGDSYVALAGLATLVVVVDFDDFGAVGEVVGQTGVQR